MANHHAIIKYKIMNMKILGLKKLEKKIIKNGDLVTSYKTYSLGDGLWSIEMMDENKRTVKEFHALEKKPTTSTQKWMCGEIKLTIPILSTEPPMVVGDRITILKGRLIKVDYMA